MGRAKARPREAPAMEREVLEFDVQWIRAGPAGPARGDHPPARIRAHNPPAAAAIGGGGPGAGVRTGDKGVNRAGERKPNFQPGAECRARATVLCEGPRGTIAKALEQQLGLSQGRNAQVYSTGVKELWEMP